MTTSYTVNFAMALPDFRMGPWHDLVNSNTSKIDQLIYGAISNSNVLPWDNAVVYNVGTSVLDIDTSQTWICNVAHTSAATGTFTADRTAHPTYWVQLISGFAPRGEWAHDTNYFPYDLAYQSSLGVFAQCKTHHVSNHSGTILDDSANWNFIYNLSSSVISATTISATGVITAGSVGATGTYRFGNTGTKSLSYDGTNFNVTGGNFIVNGTVTGIASGIGAQLKLQESGGLSKFLRCTTASNFEVINNAFSAVIMTVSDTGALSVPGIVTAGSGGTTGTYSFGNTGTKSLQYDGTNFVFNGGPVTVNSNILASGNIQSTGAALTASTGIYTGYSSASVGTYYFGNSGAKYLTCNGSDFAFASGNLTINGALVATSSITSTAGVVQSNAANAGADAYFICQDNGGVSRGYFYWNHTSGAVTMQNSGGQAINLETGGGVQLGGAMRCRTGFNGSYTGDYFNTVWNSGAGQLHPWIGNSDLGVFNITCDYRIKTNIAPLPSMWGKVKALNPISYTQCAYGDLFTEDNTERWGMIAHELQGTLIEYAATGTKDEENVVQSVNLMVVVAALTKALQEAMARIEALEAKV